MKKQNIFIDTDMGNDDIMAIAYLLMQPSIRICGVSTVNGVATKDKGYSNLYSLRKFLEKDIPIAMGSQKALIEKSACFPIKDTKRANDLTLLKNISIKNFTSIPKPIQIENFIFTQTLRQNTIILALGPLTNIAKVIKEYGKRFTENIKGLWIMGGGIARGNVEPEYKAEYNIWLDPEAAEIVFSSGIPITLVGIDATDSAPVNKLFTENVRKINPTTKEGAIIKEIIINNDNDFAAFYDPLAAFLLCKPQNITKEIKAGINIGLSGENRGQTILFSSDDTIRIVLSTNGNAFYKEMVNVIQKDSI